MFSAPCNLLNNKRTSSSCNSEKMIFYFYGWEEVLCCTYLHRNRLPDSIIPAGLPWTGTDEFGDNNNKKTHLPHRPTGPEKNRALGVAEDKFPGEKEFVGAAMLA